MHGVRINSVGLVLVHLDLDYNLLVLHSETYFYTVIIKLM